MPKILIVDDEKDIIDLITDMLSSFGYEIISTTDSREGYKMATEQNPDLIILDWMMPNYNGHTFTEDFRAAHYSTPIIMLTARGEDPDFQVEALRIGVDDYIGKPYDKGVFLARINAQLRRASYTTEVKDSKAVNTGNRHVYCGGELIIDFDSMQAYRYEQSCELTNREFQLLKYLESNAGRVCLRSELLNKVWEYDYLGDERTVDVTVRRTREKIEPSSENNKFKYIITRRGSGYVFPRDIE
ncbi:MAG: response regulator transcription factor [Clostridia bacterium]|nr:response regulator transcription factor [Clostridia bacterium]